MISNPVLSNDDKLKKLENIVRSSDDKLKPILSADQWQTLQTCVNNKGGNCGSRSQRKLKDQDDSVPLFNRVPFRDFLRSSS